MEKGFDQETTYLRRLAEFYQRRYQKGAKEDSPELSRMSLISRIRPALEKGISPPRILNIGSGPQQLEAELSQLIPEISQFHLVSLDAARIASSSLAIGSSSQAAHLRASALSLPFSENSFGLLTSNLAIDLLPRSVLNEAWRVLAPNGLAFFNFHHPIILNPTELAFLPPKIRQFRQYLKTHHLVFVDRKQIYTELETIGFKVNPALCINDQDDYWWEVDCQKPASKT